MNSHSLTRPRFFLLREIFFLCLVSALPFWLFGLSAEGELAGQMQKIREEKHIFLQKEFREAIHCEVLQLFWEYFVVAIKESWSSDSPLDALKFRIDKAKAAFPGSIEVVYFDSRGKVVASGSDRPETHALLEEFAQDYFMHFSENILEFNRSVPKYRSVLGPCLTAYRPHNEGTKISRAFFSRERAIVGTFGNFSRSPSFIFWFTIPPGMDIVEAGFRFLLFRKQELSSELLRGIVDLDLPKESWEEAFGEAAAQLPFIMGRPEAEKAIALYSGGYQWCFIPISARKRLVVAQPDYGEKFYRERQFKLLGTVILLLLGVFVFRFGIFRQRYEEFSLRSKLLFLFLYTGGIPLYLLVGSAQGVFHERRQTMEKKIFLAHVAALKDLDRAYLEYLGLIEEVAKRSSSQTWTLTPDLFEKLTRVFRNVSQKVTATWGFIFDKRGKELFHFGSKKGEGQLRQISPIFGLQIAKRAIEMEQLDESPLESTKEQAIRATAESMGLDLDEMGAERERFPGSFISLKFGTGNPLQSLDIKMKDVHGTAQAIGFLFWAGDDLIHLFLTKRLKLFMEKWGHITFGYNNHPISTVYPSQIPKDAWDTFVQQKTSLNDSLPLHQKLDHDGKTFYLTVWNGKEIDVPFLALSNDDAVRGEIRDITLRLAGTGLLMLCLGVGVALLIYRNFLSPIGILAQGMEAMRGRRFDHRVPVHSTDEFGQVALAFNSMMEGMADLEIAKVVQDTFFPQTPLRENGWEVFGTSISASKVGGDYFDYFPLKDGRWLILIGDVAGHGVAASLVVAMAKALAFHNAEKGNPSAILEAMNQSLKKNMETRRFMSCFLAIFDPQTGLFISSNAGHNYPYLIRGSEGKEISGNNALLGVKSRKPFTEQSHVLEKTDAVVFYTDGLIEALNPKGEQIGYDSFRENLPDLMGSDSAITVAAIRRQFGFLAAPGPLADDVTIIVLQRFDNDNIAAKVELPS